MTEAEPRIARFATAIDTLIAQAKALDELTGRINKCTREAEDPGLRSLDGSSLSGLIIEQIAQRGGVVHSVTRVDLRSLLDPNHYGSASKNLPKLVQLIFAAFVQGEKRPGDVAETARAAGFLKGARAISDALRGEKEATK